LESGEVSPSLSANKSTYKRFTEAFEDAFPYYLAIGMPSDEYWNGRGDLVTGYREAHERRMNHENFMTWLQGLYIYNAVGSLAPALNAMSKGKVKDYIEKPIPITKSEKEQDEIDKMNKLAVAMMAWAKNFKPKEEKEEGSNVECSG